MSTCNGELWASRGCKKILLVEVWGDRGILKGSVKDETNYLWLGEGFKAGVSKLGYTYPKGYSKNYQEYNVSYMYCWKPLHDSSEQDSRRWASSINTLRKPWEGGLIIIHELLRQLTINGWDLHNISDSSANTPSCYSMMERVKKSNVMIMPSDREIPCQMA